MLSVNSSINKQSNLDPSLEQIDDFITVFLRLINDIIKCVEDVSLNVENIIGQSTRLTTNSQVNISDLQKNQTRIFEMYNLLKENLENTGNIKNTFVVVNDSIVERQTHIIDAINEYKIIQESINVSKKSIDVLVNNTKEVAGIINTINEISQQTNMLALNASIEAARAGEFGKGFSIVANEVKKLSTQTSDATNSISKVLKKITNEALTTQNDIAKTNNILDYQISVLEETINSINKITQMLINTVTSFQTLTDQNTQSYDTCTNINAASSDVVESIKNDTITIKEIDNSVKYQSESIFQLTTSTNNLKHMSKKIFSLLQPDNNTIIAITEEYQPFIIESNDINYQGIDIDIIREICNRNNIKFKLFFAPFDLSLDLLKDGVVDMIPTISYTEQRKEFINFTNSLRDESEYMLVTDKKCKKDFNSYNDMKNCRIGIIGGYTYPSNFLNDKNIRKDENYKLDTLFHKLLKNQIDAIMLNNYVGKYYINSNKLHTEINISKYALIANEKFDARIGLSKTKKTEMLVELFNKELKNLSEEGKLKKIEDKYVTI